MRILYVEDNPANLFLVKRVARMGNHDVINLIDGEEALRKMDQVRPDLILMDIQLAGGLTGLDVVKKLRQEGHTMPIIAVTAYAMVGDKERCLEAGCDDYLAKPIPVARLVEIFQRYQTGPAEGDTRPPTHEIRPADMEMALESKLAESKKAEEDTGQPVAPLPLAEAGAPSSEAPRKNEEDFPVDLTDKTDKFPIAPEVRATPAESVEVSPKTSA